MSPAYCYKLELAYDGTGFCGWERQAQGERTLQGVLEESLQSLTGQQVSLIAAGRTDSGVHALGQVASCRLEKEVDSAVLFRGLNAILPRDVRVKSAAYAAEDFHARYSARNKTYFYQIVEAPFDDPFRFRYFHRVRKLPSTRAIREAVQVLEGERDFSALMASGSQVRSTVRRVFPVKARRGGDWVRIYFTADGFLYRMVRNMVSLVMAQARGEISREEAEAILAGKDRTKAPPTFPAKGLFLWRVRY